MKVSVCRRPTGAATTHRIVRSELLPICFSLSALLGKVGMAMSKEKRCLTLEYQEATAKFSQSVTDLRQKMGSSFQEEYEQAEANNRPLITAEAEAHDSNQSKHARHGTTSVAAKLSPPKGEKE